MSRAALAVAVGAMIVLAGPTQGAMATPPGEPVPVASPPPTDKVPPPTGYVPSPPPGKDIKPPYGTVTVTGVVSEGVEPGCRILGGYLLVGGDSVPFGTLVEVTGVVRPDLLTTCQQGTPLLVESIRVIPVPPRPDPTPDTPEKPGTITVTGVVSEGVEAGCKILTTANGGSYLLLGDLTGVPSGSVVRVVGEPRRDWVSFCMQGTPLRVSSITVLNPERPPGYPRWPADLPV